MKCKIPEISWHNRDPVLSVDIQPKTEKSSLYRLASGGTDSHVLIWSLSITETGEVNLDVAADLTRHQRAVNAVKWSPNGELLASGDDESVIFIWKQKEESEHIMYVLDNANENDKEIWITMKVLRGHMEDIYDLSWAPNSQFLVSGSVDNTAIIWDVQKGKSLSILKDHKGFVQGVAWDPKNQYIATLSTDRILRIFDIQTKKVIHRNSKSTLPVPKESDLYDKKVRLYHDDTLQTFFRRLCFSPDGKLLITPAGVVDYDGATQLLHTTYVYSRFSLKQPSIVLPSPDQYTVAVKCCPILFKLRDKAGPCPAVIPLPYRMIFAIATKSSVYLYDTQQKVPFGLISNIHYTRLTDIAWSNDGRIMIVSSTDGFCSIITFDDGELGEEYEDVGILQPLEPVCDKKNNKNKQREAVVGSKKIEPENTVTLNKKNDENVNNFPRENISHELIIDKDIISSDEKFESPEKKMRPATPIVVRRHPRTPSSTTAIQQSSSNIKSNTSSPLTSSPLSVQKTSVPASDKGSAKKATPIAIRRKPRALIPTVVEKTAIVEEAMDAWPIKVDSPEKSVVDIQPSNKSEDKLDVKKNSNQVKINENEASNDCTEDIHLVYEDTVDETSNQNDASTETPTPKKATPTKIEETNDCTEDIRLVYEDTIEEISKESSIVDNKEEPAHKNKVEKSNSIQGTPEHKSTRRVELKTISTPKSKKKLLE
ncbi:chromatin assembly factor 1 subunit B [Episyrphus balteatus]|uniref:chromatin assembly factor 1 subunit B n=1 Tax=Episyrphus balteatus TaxID=286459 RepID=UPI0024864BF3|nr:chromatin assembly factor 1 subunit B [Episyrphus balteatus]